MKATFFTSVFIFCICFLSLAVWSVARACLYFSFRNNCEKAMSRAIDTRSVETFQSEMLSVISYLDCEEKVSGTTAIFKRKGRSEISRFYDSARDCYEKSLLIKDNIPESEKLKELENIQHSLMASYNLIPAGISVAPNNRAYFIWGGISAILLSASTIILAINVVRGMK